MIDSQEKIAIFGANGFIGSCYCKYLEKKNIDFLAISRSAENINEYKNFFSLDLEEDQNWSSEFVSILKNYNSIIFLSAVVHKSSKDPYQANLNIFINFLENYKKNFKNLHNLLFVSSLDVHFSHKSYFNDSSYFPIAYARSKKVCEEILANESNINSLILRLPMVYSEQNKKNLMKRYCLNLGKIKLFFRIFPSPTYRAVSTESLNLIFSKILKEGFTSKSKIVTNKFEELIQSDILKKDSNIYFLIPRIFLLIMMKIMEKLPFNFIKSRSVILDKLISYTDSNGRNR